MKKLTIKYPEKIITKDEVFTARNQEPKIKVTESVGGDIVNYRIEEAKIDSDGNIIPKNKPPFYETTGRSLEWTIRVGETLSFPEYVANYLRNIYSFLEVVGGEDETEDETSVEAISVEGRTTCKYCGQHLKDTKGLALHIAHRHPEQIL